MSADNFVGVRPNEDGTYSIFEYGNMSCFDEDCMYLKEAKPTKVLFSRGSALVAAHDLVKDMYVCEYGVVEMPPVPKEFCGRCYVCVNVRNTIAPDLECCTLCGKPFHSSEWRVSTQVGTFHTSCEPGRR